MPKKKFINQIEPWYDKEEKRAIKQYLGSGGWIMEYKKTEELEEKIANFTGVKFCSLLPNATLALWAGLKVLGIKTRDQVIAPDFTQAATANAVRLTGADPVFTDIDRSNLCLDFQFTKKAVNKKTRAIILVSINGRCPNIKKFVKLAKENNIYLVEDAAQSFGSKAQGKYLGSFGLFGIFSFAMPKIITMGQGGALITNNKALYQKIQKFKNWGRIKGGSDNYLSLGCNLKFTDLQAVFGLAQMKKLNWRIKRKKQIYQLYRKNLSCIPQIEFIDTNLKETTPWFIDVLVPNPDKLAEYLKQKNIGARRFYPPLHTLSFYNAPGNFPITDYVSEHGLWLPSASQLKNEQINYICEKIKEFYKKS